VVVYKNTTIKSGCFIDSNSCIGPSGLAWIWDDNGNRIIQPQLGGVIIEKNCHIGTDVSITKGSLSENTIIGENTLIAHGTKIGHGCKVSKHVHMANNVSLAGNAVIGERVFLGSASIVSSNISVPNNSIVGAGTLVNKKFEEEYVTLVGVPAKILKANNYNHKPNGAPKPFKTK
jgi:UDP-3-O-[3-hydroxymyristoyl] glucosamine N-acyltransferase